MKKSINNAIWIFIILVFMVLASVIFGLFIDNNVVIIALCIIVGILVFLGKHNFYGFLDRFIKYDADNLQEEKWKQEELNEEKKLKKEEESKNYDE